MEGGVQRKQQDGRLYELPVSLCCVIADICFYPNTSADQPLIKVYDKEHDTPADVITVRTSGQENPSSQVP